MARIPVLEDRRYPALARAIFAAQRRKQGIVSEPLKLWGRVPKLLYGFLAFFLYLDRKASPIPPALRALVCTRIAQINDCSFCVDLNSFLFQKRSTEDQKLFALHDFRASPLYTDVERVTLEYAEALTHEGVKVDEALFARLREHFSDTAIVELTALIAFQNLSSKFNAALGVPAQGFCITKEAKP